MPAAAAANADFPARQALPPGRAEAIARYRRLRAISVAHHSAVLGFISTAALVQQARRLGLAHGKTLVVDDVDDLMLAYDLLIHTAAAGRSRAIDRYARSARLAEGSDEARVLEAMRQARFAIVTVERRHEAAGVIVTDLFRETELWLMDEGLEASAQAGWALATRYYAPDRFVMTAGISIPVSRLLLEIALDAVPRAARHAPAEAIDEPRVAEALYRTALKVGIMDNVTYKDPVSPDAPI